MARDYDAWLEEPYQRMCEESEGFLDWCEEYDLDPDDPKSVDAWNDWLYDQQEQAQLDAYEAAMERRAEEMAERDDW